MQKSVTALFLTIFSGYVSLYASDKLLAPVRVPASILKNVVGKPRNSGSRVSLQLERNEEKCVLEYCAPSKEAKRVREWEEARTKFENERMVLACLQMKAEKLGIDAEPDQGPFPVLDPRVVRISIQNEMQLARALAESIEREKIRVKRSEQLQNVRALAAQANALKGDRVERAEALRFADKPTYLASQGKGRDLGRSDAFRAHSNKKNQ